MRTRSAVIGESSDSSPSRHPLAQSRPRVVIGEVRSLGPAHDYREADLPATSANTVHCPPFQEDEIRTSEGSDS